MVLRKKWVHLNHCKKYEGMETVVVRTNGPAWKLSSTMSSEDTGGERHKDDLNIPETEAVSDEETPELSLGEGETVGDIDWSHERQRGCQTHDRRNGDATQALSRTRKETACTFFEIYTLE